LFFVFSFFFFFNKKKIFFFFFFFFFFNKKKIIFIYLKGFNSKIPPIESLSDEKLREIEGDLRQNIISRIRALNDVNKQLNGIVLQLNQILSCMPEQNKIVASSSSSNSEEKNKEDIKLNDINDETNKPSSTTNIDNKVSEKSMPISENTGNKSVITDNDTTETQNKGKESIESPEVPINNSHTTETANTESTINETKSETIDNTN